MTKCTLFCPLAAASSECELLLRFLLFKGYQEISLCNTSLLFKSSPFCSCISLQRLYLKWQKTKHKLHCHFTKEVFPRGGGEVWPYCSSKTVREPCFWNAYYTKFRHCKRTFIFHFVQVVICFCFLKQKPLWHVNKLSMKSFLYIVFNKIKY